MISNAEHQNVPEETDTNSKMQVMDQKMNLILDVLLSSEAFSGNIGKITGKSNADETDNLWKLLKKTQSEVNSIKNEINKVETENIHQGQGFTNKGPFRYKMFVIEFIPVKDQELEELLEASKKNIYFPVSCQEYADNGAIKNGSYRVQPNTNISRKCILA